MTIALAIVLTLGILVFALFVRVRDVPDPIPVSPLQHLEDRKAAIYENLRDLQFEYRVGKLSDADYQQTKLSLQKELAGVLAEMEKTAKTLGLVTKQAAPNKRTQTASAGLVRFVLIVARSLKRPMKFCGQCGKAMA